MAKPSSEIDPFDIAWKAVDPLDREVVMRHSIVDARTCKHAEPPEHLSVDEARQVIADPDRIDVSSSNPCRDVYYRVRSGQDYPYSRVVVSYQDDERRGLAISWSNYAHPVSSGGMRWSKEG